MRKGKTVKGGTQMELREIDMERVMEKFKAKSREEKIFALGALVGVFGTEIIKMDAPDSEKTA